MTAATAVATTETTGRDRSAVVAPLARAEHLRDIAAQVHPLVATAYRRRAAELTFGAWVQALRVAPVDIDQFTRSVRTLRAAA
jgi:hypothetical protein